VNTATFYRYDGQQVQALDELTFLRGRLVASANLCPRLVESLRRGSLKAIGPEGLKLPEDGEEFIEALPWTFRNAYCWAETGQTGASAGCIPALKRPKEGARS
jgi:hypothetical protein